MHGSPRQRGPLVHINEGVTFPWPKLDIQKAISDKDARRGGFAIKKRLVAIAKEELPCLVVAIRIWLS